MKRALVNVIALVTIAAGLMTTSPHAAVAATAIQPTRLALIVMENTSQQVITDGCSLSPIPDPYICNSLEPAGGAGAGGLSTLGGISIEGGGTNGAFASGKTDGFFEAVTSGDSTDPVKKAGSSYQYMYMTSADACSGYLASMALNGSAFNGDAYWNNAQPALSSSATVCGTDVFKQLDNASISWKSYQEEFGSGVTCTDGYSDNKAIITATRHQNYTRKHNPATFYSDVSGDCATAGASGNVVTFPYNGAVTDTGDDDLSVTAAASFRGVMLPSFSYIVPDLCHDMHNDQNNGDSRGDCSTSGSGAWSNPTPGAYTGGSCDGTTFIDSTTSVTCGQVAEGDAWLAQNLPDVLNDLGPKGAAIVTFDEGDGTGNKVSGAEQIPLYIIPGTGGTLNATTGETNTATSTAQYNMASIAKTVTNVFGATGCSAFSDPTTSHSYGKTNCDNTTTLPVEVNAIPEFVQASATAHANTNQASQSWPAGTVANDLEVLALTVAGTVTPTTPSGWTALPSSGTTNTYLYYKVPGSSESGSVSVTLSGTSNWTETLLEFKNITGTPADIGYFETSSMSTTGPIDIGVTGTTAQASELAIAITYDANSTTHTLDTVNTPGWTQVNTTTTQGTTNTTSVWYKVLSATGAQQIRVTMGTDAKWRGIISTFKSV